MNWLFRWIDNRTGYQGLIKETLFENIPGGSRWRYVWGSTLTFAITVQFITGIFLWMAYSPSASTAWESVYYIQYEMPGGWLLRGIHHYTAQVMVILLVLHLMQVVIDGAYKAPREVNFWFGVGLLMLTLGLSLTGYLLPWDQKGFWATKVATNIMGGTPVIGDSLQSVVVGGNEYGHHTLTRFFAIHAGVLPGATIALIVGHIYLFRRHGITEAKPKKVRKRDQMFWPDQVLKDAVACLAVFLTVMCLVFYFHGAGLSAPANPGEKFEARPDWYFMFLFKILKFKATDGIIGSHIIPGVITAIVMAIPFLGNWKLGHRFNLVFLWGCIGAFAVLTGMGFYDDHFGAKSAAYAEKVAKAERDAARTIELVKANGGIPSTALQMLEADPLFQGPKLFANKCASCHAYDGHNGLGEPLEKRSAADLHQFAGREWIRGLLDPDQILTPHYFGGTAFEEGSKMVSFVQDELAEAKPEELDALAAALSAQAGLPYQAAADAADEELIKTGQMLLGEDGFDCTSCHKIGDEGKKSPDLTGYGSKKWLVDFISNPAHPSFYGDRNDRMPLFGEKEILTPEQIGMLADWLRQDWVPTAIDLSHLEAAKPAAAAAKQ